jgi:hypothetical protein
MLDGEGSLGHSCLFQNPSFIKLLTCTISLKDCLRPAIGRAIIHSNVRGGGGGKRGRVCGVTAQALLGVGGELSINNIFSRFYNAML